MLKIAESLQQLSFEKLMEIYIESNRESGALLRPEESEARQLAKAEREFYEYLAADFFRRKGAYYAVWEEAGDYMSALRMEPYLDGFLLESLETALQHRGKGYAETLMQAVLERAGETTVYSHVGRKNIPSLRVHRRCGFSEHLDYARYIDGSLNSNAVTLIWKKTEKCKIKD